MTITAQDIDVDSKTIAKRPYVIRYAYEIEKGEAIWTKTDNGYELWSITDVVPNTKPEAVSPIYPSGLSGFINFVCKEGSIMHDANGGVFVDIKKGN